MTMHVKGPVSRLKPTTKTSEIALIGGGAGAMFTLRALVKHAMKGYKIETTLTVFDPKKTVGQGTAWNPVDKNLLCNMIAEDVTLDEDDPDELTRELGLGEGEKFITRVELGRYFQKQWSVWVKRAGKHGITVKEVHQSIVSISAATPHRFVITTDDSEQHRADAVILSIGQLPSHHYSEFIGCKGFHNNAWTYTPTGAEGRTLVLGAGLTSVDINTALRSAGHDDSVTWYSRSGKLPWVRPFSTETVETINREVLQDLPNMTGGHVRLTDLKNELDRAFRVNGVSRRELGAVYSAAGLPPMKSLLRGIEQSNTAQKYFSVMKDIDYLIPVAWKLLEPNDRAKFLCWYRTYSRVSFAMPSPNARRAYHWLKTGYLNIVSGEARLVLQNKKFVLIRTTETGRIVRDRFDTVINATGLGTDLAVIARHNPLIRSLLMTGLATPHPYGGVHCDFNTGQLLDSTGNRVPGIFTLNGTLNSGTRLLTNDIIEVAQQAKRTAHVIAEVLDTNGNFDGSFIPFLDPYFSEHAG